MNDFASKMKNPIYGVLGFEQETNGFSGSGWRLKKENVQASFLEVGQGRNVRSARINFDITHCFDKRTVNMNGGVTLNEQQAIELALAIMPPELASKVKELMAADSKSAA